MSRRGVSLVEVLVAFAVVGVLLGVLAAVQSSSARQVGQLESETELVRVALVLREHLARDLASGLEPEVLREDARALGAEDHELVLARFAGYDGGQQPARAYRPVRYRWAAGQGVVRDGHALGGGGLHRVRFHQAPHGAVTVELEGERPGSRLDLRFAAPARGTWRRAPHHRGARLAP